jgi:CHAT domain-containing protein/tetratricopeptide (TPR) repeat protein
MEIAVGNVSVHLICFGCALALSGRVVVAAPIDALELEKQAIARFEKFRLDQRRTGSGDRGQLLTAIQELSSSEAEFERQGRLADAARSVYEAGRCQRVLNDAAAGPTYLRARDMARQAGDPTLEAKISYSLGAVSLYMNRDLAGAEARIEEGLVLAKSISDSTVRFDLLDLRGDLEAKRNDFVASVRTYDELTATLEPLRDAQRLYSAYTSRGSALFELGLSCSRSNPTATCLKAVDRAKADFERAAAVAGGEQWTFLADSARKQAGLAELEMKNITVGAAIDEARQRGPEGAIPNLSGANADLLADLQRELTATQELRRKSSTSARPEVERAMDEALRNVAAENAKAGEAIDRLNRERQPTNIGTRIEYINPREPKDVLTMDLAPPVERDLNTGLAGLSAWLVDHPDPKVREWFAAAQSAIHNGDHNAALTAYMRLLSLLEDERNRVGDARGRELFMRDKSEIYNLLARNLLAENRDAEAFDLVERSRGRTLTEMLSARAPKMESESQRMQLAKLLWVQAELELRQRDNLSPGFAGDPEFERAYAAYAAELESLRRTAPKVVDLYRPRPVGLTDLQALVASDHADVLQYIVSDSGVVIWHIGAGSTKKVRVVLSREHLAQKLKAVLASAKASEGDFDRVTAYELYLFLIAPVEDQIRTRHLVILPGELGPLPFALLQPKLDGATLGEEYQISVAPSAGLLTQLSRTDRLGDARIVSVVNTSLPGAQMEAQALSTTYRAHTVLKNPSPPALLSKLSGYDAVHFATHGKFSEEGPMLASLQLHEGDGGSITAAETFALPLRSAKVVTLGACESGRVGSAGLDEWHGLARGFLFAGAQALVLASWKVPDDASVVYMTTFYREARTQPLSEAARRALVAVKAKYPRPNAWAAFLYVGR